MCVCMLAPYERTVQGRLRIISTVKPRTGREFSLLKLAHKKFHEGAPLARRHCCAVLGHLKHSREDARVGGGTLTEARAQLLDQVAEDIVNEGKQAVAGRHDANARRRLCMGKKMYSVLVR